MTTSRCCSSPPQQKRWPKILLFLCLLQQQPVWGENTYSLVDDANQCDSVNQRNGITTKAECEAAATILGLAETSARVEDNPHGTPGCYIHMSGLWFNTFTTSTVLCSFSTITCICSSPTVSAGITYVEVDSGHCHSTSGRARIETKAMCREAARSVGLTTEMMVQHSNIFLICAYVAYSFHHSTPLTTSNNSCSCFLFHILYTFSVPIFEGILFFDLTNHSC